MIAHELTHVAQQGASRVKLSGGEGSPGYIQRWPSLDWFKKDKSNKSGDSSGGKSRSRFSFGNWFKKDKQTQSSPEPSRPTFDPEQDEEVQSSDNLGYERNLGRYAYRHPKARTAVAGMMAKATNSQSTEVTGTTGLNQQLAVLFSLSGTLTSFHNDQDEDEGKESESQATPQNVGPAGMTHRIFQLWQSLGKPVPAEDLRLAVLGWTLSVKEGCFHETMRASSAYGLPYTPGVQGYMEVFPLTLIELRENVADNNEFPHEKAFNRKVHGGGFKMFGSDTLSAAQSVMSQVDWSGDESSQFGRGIPSSSVGGLGTTSASMLYFYSSYGYLLMNPTMKGTGLKSGNS